MTEGAVEPVEHAPAPAGEPKRKSWFERLKPIWWLRGVLGAWALVGLLDQLGLIREDWLRIVHALAARWKELVSAAAGWLNLHLPFVYLSDLEASIFALASIVYLPIVLGSVWKRRRATHPYTMTMLFACAIVGVGMLPAAGDVFSTYELSMVFGLLLVLPIAAATVELQMYSIGLSALLLVCMTILFYARNFMTGDSKLIDLVSMLAAIPVMASMLWATNRAYAKALFVTLSFVLTLEVFYLVPAINQAMRGAVDWIDPGIAGSTP